MTTVNFLDSKLDTSSYKLRLREVSTLERVLLKRIRLPPRVCSLGKFIVDSKLYCLKMGITFKCT